MKAYMLRDKKSGRFVVGQRFASLADEGEPGRMYTEKRHALTSAERRNYFFFQGGELEVVEFELKEVGSFPVDKEWKG